MIKSAMLRFEKFLGETPRAVLVRINNKEEWLPKSQCRNFVLNKKLGGNVVLPTFIINRILGIDINEMEISELPSEITPKWIVEHHTPEKIQPIENNIIKELEK
ncbi:hypothetical protein FACS189434_07860 [Bacteroidia bacterium]|nr:hypothetical protein FACS189434_07860 [Bacteroidia bacterium]